MEATERKQQPFWRQGDIYFVKLDEEPRADGTPVKNGVIAKGETRGHSHRLSPSSMTQGAVLSLAGRSMFLRSPQAGTKIVHDEHAEIDLPAGLFAVVPQREFDGLPHQPRYRVASFGPFHLSLYFRLVSEAATKLGRWRTNARKYGSA